jgi:hypothetical protein
VGTGDFTSTYKDITGNYTVSASSSYGRRTRSTIRLDYKTLVANPELPTTNNPISMSAYLVVDRNAVGFSTDDLVGLSTALLEMIADNDYQNLGKVLTGQS